MLSFCLAGSRRGAITDLYLRMSACNLHTVPPPCLPHSAGTGHCGLDHTQSNCCVCHKACQNRQLNLKSGVYPSTRMNWPPFRSRTKQSLFCTVTQLYKPTYKYHLFPLAPTSLHRSISHSLVYTSKSRHQDDEDVDLQVLSQFESREGGGSEGRVKRRQNPWKLKQLRFTRHIVNLIRKGKVAEAQNVFGHMQDQRVLPEVPVFNSLIAGYGRQGDAKAAFKLFNDMKKRRLLPTDRTYTSLFNACAKAGPKSLVYLEKIQAEIERRSIHLNIIASNALISALASCEQHESAFQVYLDILKMNISPDIQTFGSLLEAASKDPERGLEKAQRVWSEMLASSFSPDLYSYNLLLRCFRDAGIPENMKQPAMVEKGIPRITESRLRNVTNNYSKEKLARTDVSLTGKGENGFVEMVRRIESTAVVHFTLSPGHKLTLFIDPKGLRWVDEVETIAALKQAKTRLDIRTFHLLASLVVDSGYLLQKIATRRGVEPDSRFMVAAIRMQAQLRNIEGAKALVRYAEGRGIALDQLGYQAIASSCTREEEGRQLLGEMNVAGVRPNEFVFGTLIGNAARHRRYEYLTALLKAMKHAEVLPNQTILQIVESVINNVPTSPVQKMRYNGFNGYYNLWKKTMCE